MEQVTIPNGWSCRNHQKNLAAYILQEKRGLRALDIWHRRGGKDSTALNLTAIKAHRGIPGTYWHLLPTQVQARKVVWNGIDGEGRRIIDQVWPEGCRQTTNAQDMFIRLKCGSAWQLAGSDNYNSLVGSNVRGVVFSEWALCDPAAWNYIRPILLENGGWAIFITTPRGRNHCWSMYERVKDNPRWHCELLNVEQTLREDGTRIFTDDMLEMEREDGMSEEMIQQEYYCSFAAGVVGSYYGRVMEEARTQHRIGKVPHDQLLPVHTYWDIGIDDSTAVWFGQRRGLERRWLAYREWKDTPLLDIFEEVNAMRQYRYALHQFPHDSKHREKSTGRRIIEYANDVFDGNGDAVVVPIHSIEDGIEATRHLIKQSWFDEEQCELGIYALLNYRKKFDEKLQAYHQTPLHDWSSHGADAFRMAAWVDSDEPEVDTVESWQRTAKPKVNRSFGRAR